MMLKTVACFAFAATCLTAIAIMPVRRCLIKPPFAASGSFMPVIYSKPRGLRGMQNLRLWRTLDLLYVASNTVVHRVDRALARGRRRRGGGGWR